MALQGNWSVFQLTKEEHPVGPPLSSLPAWIRLLENIYCFHFVIIIFNLNKLTHSRCLHKLDRDRVSIRSLVENASRLVRGDSRYRLTFSIIYQWIVRDILLQSFDGDLSVKESVVDNLHLKAPEEMEQKNCYLQWILLIIIVQMRLEGAIRAACFSLKNLFVTNWRDEWNSR